MIPFDEALAAVARAARPLDTERVRIADAAGRVLAQPVSARVDSPRADVSAMDGYAVRDRDLEGPLTVVGESYPGAGWGGTLRAGECVRIFTGAPLPAGAERVIIQEDVRREGGLVFVRTVPDSGRHIRRRGSDFVAGAELLRPGRLLDARAIVTAAAADAAELEVFRRPRLVILSTGDELAEPGEAGLSDDAIPESISLGIAALAQAWGATIVRRRRLGDELQALEAAAADALAAADVVVVTGGASVGDRDFAKAMFVPAGLELMFGKVAIKPGKPVWLGRAGGKLVIGLPGNPTSAVVTARLLLAPLLAGLCGRSPDAALCWRSIPLASPLGAGGDRETFHRARAEGGAAHLVGNQDSAAQRALAEADLLVRQRPRAEAVPAGGLVEAVDF